MSRRQNYVDQIDDRTLDSLLFDAAVSLGWLLPETEYEAEESERLLSTVQFQERLKDPIEESLAEWLD